MCNQRLWVENPELLNMHKRLTIKSLFIEYSRSILRVVNNYILGGEFRTKIERMFMNICLICFLIGCFRSNLSYFGFTNFEQLNPMGIMANTNLTNQRQVFVEEYVRSGDK